MEGGGRSPAMRRDGQGEVGRSWFVLMVSDRHQSPLSNSGDVDTVVTRTI